MTLMGGSNDHKQTNIVIVPAHTMSYHASVLQVSHLPAKKDSFNGTAKRFDSCYAYILRAGIQ